MLQPAQVIRGAVLLRRRIVAIIPVAGAQQTIPEKTRSFVRERHLCLDTFNKVGSIYNAAGILIEIPKIK